MKTLPNEIKRHAKTNIGFVLCTIVALSAAAALADDKDKGAPPKNETTETGKASQLSRGDEHFIQEAHKGGHMEVKMGNLAVQKGQSSEVKQFGQRLIDDHTKAGAELKQLASSKGVTLPDNEKIAGAKEETDRIQVREKEGVNDENHKVHAEMKKLESLSGAEFDRAFAKMAVTDHEKDIKLFEKASQNGNDAEVKAFAAKTLPTLREHLQQAQTLQTSTK
jgi:putative membrane protein